MDVKDIYKARDAALASIRKSLPADKQVILNEYLHKIDQQTGAGMEEAVKSLGAELTQKILK